MRSAEAHNVKFHGLKGICVLMCGYLQVRRAGALAVTKAVADHTQLELLDLDANEIPDSAIDNIKVCFRQHR